MAPKEALGPGDGEAFRLRRRVWPSRWEMFRTLQARAPFNRWRPDVLWTYVEEGTQLLESQSASAGTEVRLRCSDETELRFLQLGRPLDGAIEIEVSPLSQPAEAAERLIEVLDELSSRLSWA